MRTNDAKNLNRRRNKILSINTCQKYVKKRAYFIFVDNLYVGIGSLSKKFKITKSAKLIIFFIFSRDEFIKLK